MLPGRDKKAATTKLVEDEEHTDIDPEVDSALDTEAEEVEAIDARDLPGREMDATKLYLSEIGFSPLLSAEEEVYFSRLAQKGDEAARARMIESNLRLVVKIARRYMNRGLELLDLN